jgi:hypothetical protein
MLVLSTVASVTLSLFTALFEAVEKFNGTRMFLRASIFDPV